MVDNPELPDMGAVATRVIEIMGGREKAFVSIDAEFHAMNVRWEKTCGGVLNFV